MEVKSADSDYKAKHNQNFAADGQGSSEDESLSSFTVNEKDVELTTSEQRRLHLKTMLFMIIVPGTVFAVQWIDKSSMSAASVMGIRKDLKHLNKHYQWVTISYNIGYLVANIPFSLFLLEKLGPRWAGLMLSTFGIVTACMSASESMAGIFTCRTLLGILESVAEPAASIITAQWAHPDYQYAWTEVWQAWGGFSKLFLQCLGYGLYIHEIKHDYSIKAWRILFIVVGLITFFYALIFFFLVPNSPQDASFLTEREKAYMRRVRYNDENRRFKKRKIEWNQIIEAFTKSFHHSFLLFIIIFCNSLNGSAVNTFINIIIKNDLVEADHKLTNVESNRKSLLYGMIPGGLKCGVCAIIAVLSGMGIMRRYRIFYMTIFNALHVAACCMFIFGKQPNVRLAGALMYNTSVEVVHAGIYSIVQSNNGNGYTKIIVTNNIVLYAQYIGGIVGPQIFKGLKTHLSSPPKRAAMVALSAVSMGGVLLLFFLYFVENKIRDRRNEKLPEGTDSSDLTDIENPEFRYHY